MTETNTEGARDKAKQRRETAIKILGLSQALIHHFVSWRLMRISISALVLLLAVFSLLVLFLEIYKRIPDWDTYGVIIVESPEVYTRERLVNDRLRETAWLERQLRVTEGGLLNNTNFRTVEATLRGVDRLNVGAAVASPNTEKSEDKSEENTAAATENSGSANSAVGPTTTELFRAMSNFRDEVRAEIMRTQLDDRHDIEGNTLYRLIFDTTVLPGENTGAWAIVHVRLKPDPSFSEGENSGNGEEDLGDALFDDWRDYVESIVNESTAVIFSDVWNRRVSPKSIQSLFDLQRELKDQIVDLARYGEAVEHEDKLNEEPVFEHEDKLNEELGSFSDDYIKRLEAGLKKHYENQVLQPLSPEPPTYGRAVEKCRRSDKKAKGRLIWQYTPKSPNEPDPQTIIDVPCPGQIRGDFERFFATMHFYNIFRRMAHLLPEDLDTALKKTREMCEADKLACGRGARPIEWRANCTLVELYIKLVSEKFDPYFDLQTDGEDLENCRVRFGYKFDDDKINVGRKAFLDKLTKSPMEAFSYGVTPRNLVQRISASLTSTISASLSAAQRGLNPASGGAAEGQDGTQALFDLLHQTSRDVQAIENRPIVVGYGWSGRFVDASASDIDEAPELSSEADFGWMIGPRLNVDGEIGAKRYTHVAGQYPLSAVISVPSWWRRLNLDVTTCWVSPSTINAELEEPLEGVATVPSPEIALALKMGAEIKIEHGVIVPWADDGRPFESFVKEAQSRRGSEKGTFIDLLWKEIVNSLYGKTAQGLRLKTAFSPRSGRSEEVPRSRITNPFIAAYTTSLVRAVLGEILHNIPADRTVVCATTDGFLANASRDEIDTGGPLCSLFADLRERLSGNREILEVKHKVKRVLCVKTRCQITVEAIEGERSVLAKGGIWVPREVEDHNEFMLNLFRERTHETKLSVNMLTSLREIYTEECDLVSKSQDRRVNLCPDFKRELINSAERDGLLFCESRPWRTGYEFDTTRALFEEWRRNHVLKTLDDWRAWRDYEAGTQASQMGVRRSKGGVVDQARRTFLRAYTRRLWDLPGGDYKAIAEWLTAAGYPTSVSHLKNSKRAKDPVGSAIPLDAPGVAEFVQTVQERFPNFEWPRPVAGKHE